MRSSPPYHRSTLPSSSPLLRRFPPPSLRRLPQHSLRLSAPSAAVRTVSIPYSDLKDKRSDLSNKIEEGFGPDGLGILAVSGVPGYSVLRENLLTLAPRLANLAEDVKKDLEDPESRYNFGWSHGKEKLESGKPDTFKGSFYANPILDVPSNEVSLMRRYPSYCRPNIWPDSSLPELEIAFKALGKLLLDIGLLLAHHCDKYVLKKIPLSGYKSLEVELKHSCCHKGRLLYYFPKMLRVLPEDTENSSWCGWHTDHGSLTGLTCGMFMKDAVQIKCPDNDAGLYIKTRTGKLSKVFYGEDEIAFQIGETTEIASNGYLCATPHCVKAPNNENAFGVGRSTFALFMQPNWDEILHFPSGSTLHKELTLPNGSLTFGDYSEMLLNKYYDRLQ